MDWGIIAFIFSLVTNALILLTAIIPTTGKIFDNRFRNQVKKWTKKGKILIIVSVLALIAPVVQFYANKREAKEQKIEANTADSTHRAEMQAIINENFIASGHKDSTRDAQQKKDLIALQDSVTNKNRKALLEYGLKQDSLTGEVIRTRTVENPIVGFAGSNFEDIILLSDTMGSAIFQVKVANGRAPAYNCTIDIVPAYEMENGVTVSFVGPDVFISNICTDATLDGELFIKITLPHTQGNLYYFLLKANYENQLGVKMRTIRELKAYNKATHRSERPNNNNNHYQRVINVYKSIGIYE